MEKRSSNRTLITSLKDAQGVPHSDPAKLLEVTKEYYTKLFTNTHTDAQIQEKLLRNIKKHVENNGKNHLFPLDAQPGEANHQIVQKCFFQDLC